MIGWLAAFALAMALLRLRRRLELVARAEHELRGPVTAFSLAVETARRTPPGPGLAKALDCELARIRAGLDDLSAARCGRRARPVAEPLALASLARSAAAAWAPACRLSIDWRAGEAAVRADRGRVAQALGNLLANAVEHGDGEVELSARRCEAGVRLEVANRPRGRGLSIARAAARDAGGSLAFASGPDGAVATLELPLAS